MSTKPVKIPNVAIFAAGNYGEKGAYTPDDIAWMADAANKSKHIPPVTIDHKQDGPKYGEVLPGSFRAKDGVLYADLAVAPAFADTVRNKGYDKRSIELYAGRTPEGEAVPGKHTVAAVTFLGAQRPEVKGLPEIAAFASDAPLVHVDFSEDESETEAPLSIADQIREGIAEAIENQIAPIIAKEIAAMTAPATPPVVPPAVAPMAEIPATPDATAELVKRIAALEAALAAKATESADMAEKIKCAERKAHETEVKAFLESAAEKITPAIAAHFSEALIALGPSSPVVSFADGKTPVDVAGKLRAAISALAPLRFGERTAPQRVAPAPANDPHNTGLNARAAVIFAEKSKLNSNYTYPEAILEANRQIEGNK